MATRIAVISDIHANLHALDAVLAAIAEEGVDELWCLGDVIGYGPRPNECVAVVREGAAVCLAGNHDLVVLGKIDSQAFVGEAAAAARWTASVLEPEARAFLDTLVPRAEAEDAQLYHGSPLDPIWDYVLSEPAARESFAATSAPLVLVGHSHVALGILAGPGGLHGGQAPAGTELVLGEERLLLNPGSVGQPRDGDPRAAWLLIDKSAGRARFRRTDYPVEQTQAEMRERGLPEALAARLSHGV
ncbi:MAG: metallophosphoesterase family protein [Actinobacteria bacterium]|nr:metallophosphoesterase family protein [Actinomycetota bacterium]